MRVRRQTVEHPCGTIKSWMGSALPDENAQARLYRNGAARLGLHHVSRALSTVIASFAIYPDHLECVGRYRPDQAGAQPDHILVFRAQLMPWKEHAQRGPA